MSLTRIQLPLFLATLTLLAACVSSPPSCMSPQTRNLGQPFLYATTEVGDVNTYVHVWAYKDATDRAERRAALWADPEWIAYTKLSAEAGYLIKQENRILVAAPFFKPGG